MSAEDLPAPRFELLVEQLAVTALSQLGKIPNPVTGRSEVSVERARYTIGLLEILRARTSGNLEAAEDQHLRQRLEELQIALLQLSEDRPRG